MIPHIRNELRKAWGMCERHAWAALFVEAAFRSDFMHSAVLLYEDLMEIAVRALNARGAAKLFRIRLTLNESSPCIMCKMGIGPHSKAIAREELIETGKNLSNIIQFSRKTMNYWKETVCGICADQRSPIRCRKHLLEDLSKITDLVMESQRNMVNYIFKHLSHYSRSFRWEFRGTEMDDDRAALISAVGWCSGWRPLLSILK